MLGKGARGEGFAAIVVKVVEQGCAGGGARGRAEYRGLGVVAAVTGNGGKQRSEALLAVRIRKARVLGDKANTHNHPVRVGAQGHVEQLLQRGLENARWGGVCRARHSRLKRSENPTWYARWAAPSRLWNSAYVWMNPVVALIASRHWVQNVWLRQRVTPPHPIATEVVEVVVEVVPLVAVDAPSRAAARNAAALVATAAAAFACAVALACESA